MVKNKNWFLKTIPWSGTNQLAVSFQVLWPLSNMPYISSDRKWPRLPFPVVGLFILMPPSKFTQPSTLHIKVKPLIIDTPCPSGKLIWLCDYIQTYFVHYMAWVEKKLFLNSCIVYQFESCVKDEDLFLCLTRSPGFYLLRMLFSHRH